MQNVHKYQQISDNGEEGTPLVRVNPIPGLACRIYPLLSWSWAQLVSGNYSNLQSITLHHAQPRPGLGWDGIEH